MTRARLLLVLLAFAGASCSDDDDDGPQEPSDPYLRVTVTPPIATVSLTVNAVFNIAVTRGGLYGGNITLTAEGLPASLVANFQPSPLVGTQDRSTLTISPGPGVTPGNYTFTIRASGPGVDPASSSHLTVVVTN